MSFFPAFFVHCDIKWRILYEHTYKQDFHLKVSFYNLNLSVPLAARKKMFINLSMCIFNLKAGAHTSLFSRLENVHPK